MKRTNYPNSPIVSQLAEAKMFFIPLTTGKSSFLKSWSRVIGCSVVVSVTAAVILSPVDHARVNISFISLSELIALATYCTALRDCTGTTYLSVRRTPE